MAKISDGDNAAITFDNTSSFAWTKRDVAENKFSFSSKNIGQKLKY